MKNHFVRISFLCLFSFSLFAQNELKVPSFEELISLRAPNNPRISPDGRHVLFQLGTTDWKENRYDTEIWISKNDGKPFPLTHNPKGSSYGARWSPDGRWIAFLSKRGDHTQIQVMRTEGGEAFPAAKVDGDIQSFEWSPDGKKFAFTMQSKDSKVEKKTKERYGAFAADDEVFKLSWLWLVDFKPEQINPSERPCYEEEDKENDCLKWPKPVALIDSVDFTISNFKWSPDGSKIAFNKRPNPFVISFMKSDIGLVDIQSKKWKTLVSNESSDNFVAWSPDSKSILYSSALADTSSNFYKNGHLFRMVISNGNTQELAVDFDEEIRGLSWTKSGIYALAYQRTKRPLLRIDPKDGSVQIIPSSVDRIYSYTISKGEERMALYGEKDHSLREVYVSELANFNPKRITSFSNQIKNWKVAQSEVISWKSKDGSEIEGVLHKPYDYDPSKKYPLLVVIHGGPTGIDRPSPVPGYVYPIVQWLNTGALVLRPNYRGSAGYGEKFRSLNVKNLGVGDAWDVLSGVDYLESKNMIDTSKMGAMGWSQGGYISAFLTTTSKRFKAISVGAGISNWMTYYVNTDIHPFTRQYLKATPWSDPKIYEKTSPMSYINQATTPTLIQHGEFDRRVPIPNAYELLQGLRDVGVTSKLIVYKGFGHGINKPKERLAATWHNWQWFGKYVFGKDIKIPVE